MSKKAFKSFMTVWAGEFVSSIGSGLTAFALAVYVYQQTHTAVSVSLVTLCAFLPSVLLAPVGGVLADRFDRRLLMMLGDFCSAFGLILMLIILMTANLTVGQICLCIAFSSIFTAFMEPAYKATVTDLLTQEEYARASGLIQIASSAKYLISPVLAGLLLSVADLKVILLIDISTFAVTVSTTFTVKKHIRTALRERKKKRFFAELEEGWKTVITDRGIFILVLLMSVVTFSIGFLQTLLTPLILPLSDEKTLGIIVSLSAVGMLLGSIMISVISPTRKYINILSVGLGVSGIAFSLMGLTTNVMFITGAGILFFAALPFVNTGADVLIRRNIDNEVQGRAWGIISILSQAGYLIAYACAGVLADRVFNPLLEPGGLLASTLGKILGTGDGRGIALLFILFGLLVAGMAIVINRIHSIRSLESKSTELLLSK